MNLREGLQYCSSELLKGMDWIEPYASEKLAEYLSGSEREKIFDLTEEFYAMLKMNHPAVSYFIDSVRSLTIEEFFNSDWLFECPHLLYYLNKMGFGSDDERFASIFKETVQDCQTIKGYIPSNCYDHTGAMRVLIVLEPQSEATKLAIRYFCDNYERLSIEEIAVGVLALFEYDYYSYKLLIEQCVRHLKDNMTPEGHSDIKYSVVGQTSMVIQAISCVCGINDPYVNKGIQWLKSVQIENGSWEHESESGLALLALISAGEGFKVSIEELEKSQLLSAQKHEVMRPHLVSTMPFEADFSIKEKIKEMIYSSTSKIWICSRFITEFWTDLITLKRDKPEIDIRIITIPLKDARSKIMGDGKKFVDIAYDSLQRVLMNNLKTTEYLHARCIITDTDLMISSADLSSEQLEKEINFGVCVASHLT